MKITKVEDRLTLVFHRQPEDLFFDSHTTAGPDTTKSGNWEVWEISAEGSDHVGGIEDVEFVPENIMLEIASEDPISIGTVHVILNAYKLAFDLGRNYGQTVSRRTAKFALASLAGEISSDELEEAAEEYYFQQGNKN